MTKLPLSGLLVTTALLPALTPSAHAQTPREELFAHSAEFRREVVQVTDNVYSAVGFALGNSMMVVGDSGVIIIDTTDGADAARQVKAEFDRITDKPVRAIIYTHSHPDHVRGASVFAGDDDPLVIAHESLLNENQPASVGRGGRDGGNQFGSALPDSLRPNAGIGARLELGGGSAYLRPTRTFASERAILELAGIEVHLVHAPGETDDQIYVWMPQLRVLFPGDNLYRAFPNLYAIRGVPIRRVDWWIDSLQKMIGEDPAYIVPSHGRPILGVEASRDVLTAYHNGVKSIYDQTIEGMNAGLRPDELVETVRLPEDLERHPYLREFYGTVPWAVRTIYNYHLGWFDGNASNLFPLPLEQRARRIAEMAGGAAVMRENARSALAAEDLQWAAELSDYLLVMDATDREAMLIKASALELLGDRQISANARNWYLSSAQWLREQAAQ